MFIWYSIRISLCFTHITQLFLASSNLNFVYYTRHFWRYCVHWTLQYSKAQPLTWDSEIAAVAFATSQWLNPGIYFFQGDVWSKQRPRHFERSSSIDPPALKLPASVHPMVWLRPGRRRGGRLALLANRLHYLKVLYFFMNSSCFCIHCNIQIIIHLKT